MGIETEVETQREAETKKGVWEVSQRSGLRGRLRYTLGMGL